MHACTSVWMAARPAGWMDGCMGMFQCLYNTHTHTLNLNIYIYIRVFTHGLLDAYCMQTPTFLSEVRTSLLAIAAENGER